MLNNKWSHRWNGQDHRDHHTVTTEATISAFQAPRTLIFPSLEATTLSHEGTARQKLSKASLTRVSRLHFGKVLVY